MPLHFTKKNQAELLDAALEATGSTGWKGDAVAFAACRDPDGAPVAIGVFQGFGGTEAELHFCMAPGTNMTRSVIDGFKMIAFHEHGLGLHRLWAPISEHNRAGIRTAVGAGWDIEFRKRAGMPGGEDAIVFSMSSDAGLAAARPQTKPISS